MSQGAVKESGSVQLTLKLTIKKLELNLLRLVEDLAVNVPEFEVNFLVDERNLNDGVSNAIQEGEPAADDLTEATRICVENTCLMEKRFEGMTGAGGRSSQCRDLCFVKGGETSQRPSFGLGTCRGYSYGLMVNLATCS